MLDALSVRRRRTWGTADDRIRVGTKFPSRSEAGASCASSAGMPRLIADYFSDDAGNAPLTQPASFETVPPIDTTMCCTPMHCPLALTGRPQFAPVFNGKPIAPVTGIRGEEGQRSGATDLGVSRVRPVLRPTRHQRRVYSRPRGRGETAHRDCGAVQELGKSAEVRTAWKVPRARNVVEARVTEFAKIWCGPDNRLRPSAACGLGSSLWDLRQLAWSRRGEGFLLCSDFDFPNGANSAGRLRRFVSSTRSRLGPSP